LAEKISRPRAAKRRCVAGGKRSRAPFSSAQPIVTVAASTKRQNTETSGATSPTCSLIAYQEKPQANTVMA
jgi:hypothetical protein